MEHWMWLSMVLSLAGAPVQARLESSTAQRAQRHGLALVRHDGGGVAGVELRALAAADSAPWTVELVPLAADDSSDVGHTSGASVWSGSPIVAAWRGALSFAPGDDGSCTIAGTMDGGATRSLSVWRADANVLNRTAGARVPTVLFDALRAVRLTNLASSAESGAPLVRDLFDPIVFQHDGTSFVVASGRGVLRSDTAAQNVTWIGALPAVAPQARELGLWNTELSARWIADGIDPRVVRADAEWLVAVRAPATHAQERGDAPVRFYRSRDLSEWTLDERLSGGLVARADYAIAFGAGSVWIASATGDAGRSVEVLRFDGGRAAWERTAATNAHAGGERVWLVPAAPGSRLAPELVTSDGNGRLVRRSL